jgi:hypothetical protein
MKFTTFLLAALLGFGSAYSQAPSDLAKLGTLYGSDIYGVNTSGLQVVRITGNLSAGTQFAAERYKNANRDDFCNAGFSIYWVKCASVTTPKLVDITDFVNSTGTFTTANAGANYAIGDWGYIVFGAEAANLEFGKSGGAVATGVVTTASGANSVVDPTDADTITVSAFSDLNTTLFSGLASGTTASRYYLKFAAADDAADAELVGQYRAIRSLSATGVVIYEPGFDVGGSTDVIDAGDIVQIVPMDVINPNPQQFYRGTVLSGSATTAIFPELIGIDDIIQAGATIKCIHDQAGSEEGRIATVASFTAATGTVTFTAPTTNTLSPTVNDQYEIQWTAASEMLMGPNGIPTTLTGVFPAAGVSLYEDIQFIADSLRKVAALLDATAPQGLATTLDHSNSTWNTTGTHEVFNVTGDVEFWLMITDSVNITSGGASDTFRVEVATTAVGGATTVLMSFDSDEWDAGEQVVFLVATAAPTVPASGGLSLSLNGNAGSAVFHGISRSLDIGYEIVTTANTGGLSRWNLLWRPLISGQATPATVVLGAGGAL